MLQDESCRQNVSSPRRQNVYTVYTSKRLESFAAPVSIKQEKEPQRNEIFTLRSNKPSGPTAFAEKTHELHLVTVILQFDVLRVCVYAYFPEPIDQWRT